MSESGDWVWTTEAAKGLRMGGIALRECADALGIELREHPTDARKRVIHREDVALVAETMERARRNREARRR